MVDDPKNGNLKTLTRAGVGGWSRYTFMMIVIRLQADAAWCLKWYNFKPYHSFFSIWLVTDSWVSESNLNMVGIFCGGIEMSDNM